jgi:Ca-activated chloride channel homolog
MDRTCARKSLLIVLALVLGASVLAAARQTAFRTKVDLVRVYVTVSDQADRLVTNLEREAFEIRDNGSQPIMAFDNTPTPIRIIVLLDTSASMQGTLPLLQKAAGELFVRLRPDDLARVGYFGARFVMASPFTRDEAALRAALPSTGERGANPRSGTVLWRTLGQSMPLFDAAASERPVILLLSDGKDRDPLPNAPVTITDVIDQAQRLSVMIYSIGVRGWNGLSSGPSGGTGSGGGFIGSGTVSALLAPPDSYADIHPDLRRVADETGGGYLEVSKKDDLAAAFARVADELHAQYLLGYVPPKSDGKVHKIDVRVNRPGLRARARKTYVAAREEK